MNSIRMFSAAFVLFGLTASVNAGLFGHGDCGKGCGCAEDCQPECCKPTIARPCCPSVHTYQRACSTIKPPCCDSSCAPSGCCAPAACGNGCCEATCAAPAGNGCCGNGCCGNGGCGNELLRSHLCGSGEQWLLRQWLLRQRRLW